MIGGGNEMIESGNEMIGNGNQMIGTGNEYPEDLLKSRFWQLPK